jgi:hypothetical protein
MKNPQASAMRFCQHIVEKYPIIECKRIEFFSWNPWKADPELFNIFVPKEPTWTDSA